MAGLPTPSEMIAHLDRFVYGQELAKRDLSVAVYNHYLALAARQDPASIFPDFGKQHVLVLGPTGSGKTYLVQTLAELLGVPIQFESATSLVGTGYVGRHIDEVVRGLLDRADGDPFRAEHAILFIDEIDKIRTQSGSGRDVSGQDVQNGLLTMLDGRVLHGVDTSRLLVLCTGAFSGLADVVRQRVGRSRDVIGFRGGAAAPDVAAVHDSQYAALRAVELEDLRDYGFIPEFIGRFSTVTVLHELSPSDLVQVLTRTENSILARQAKLFELHGIELVFEDDAIEAIAERAAALGTGARGLVREVLRCLDPVDWRLPELSARGVTRIVVGPAVVLDGKDPRLEIDEKLAGARETPAEALRATALLPRVGADAGGFDRRRGFTDGTRLSEDELHERIETTKAKVGWEDTTGSARKWWNSFEEEQSEHDRLPVVLRLLEELHARRATITEFFLAYVYSNTDNIQANLHYLDYRKLKDEHDAKRKASARDEGEDPEA